MQQEKGYLGSGLGKEVKQYSTGGLSTAGSPKNINQFAAYMFPTSSTQIQSSYHNNPEVIVSKPISVQVHSSIQGLNMIRQVQKQQTIGTAQNVGANLDHQVLGLQQYKPGSSSHNINNPSLNTAQNIQYQRIIDNKRVIPSRPNFHFFGSDSRQNISTTTGLQQGCLLNKNSSYGGQNNCCTQQGVQHNHQVSSSQSPPVIQNQNFNSQSPHSNSHSPITVHSNSSDANNRSQQRISFSYGGSGQGQIIQSVQTNTLQIQNNISDLRSSQQRTTQLQPISQPITQPISQSISQPLLQPSIQSGPQMNIYSLHNFQTNTSSSTPPPAQHQPLQPIQPPTTFYPPIQPVQQNQVKIHNNIDYSTISLPYPYPYPINTNQFNPFPTQQLQPLQQQLPIMHVGGPTHVVTTTTIIWQHRFVAIYSKFQIFVQKFQYIIDQIYEIDGLFDNVNDQQAWNDLRVRYTDMIQSFNAMREDIILVLEEHKNAINSLSPQVVKQISQKQIASEQQKNAQGGGQQNQQNEGQQEEEQRGEQEGGQTGKSGSQNNHVWENRCLELMQQHQILTKENNELKGQIQRLNMQAHEQQQHHGERKPRVSEHDSNIKVLDMQKNLNLIHSEYQKLEANYNNLSIEYSRVVSELHNRAQSNAQPNNQNAADMEQQYEMAQAKMGELYEQLQARTDNIEQLQKQIESYGQILEQNKTLMETVNKMNHDLDSYQNQLKNKEKIIGQYDDQVKRLHQQIIQYSKSLQQKQEQANVQMSNQNTRTLEHDKSQKQLDQIHKQNKQYLNMIERHEQSIQQMALKNQKLTIQHEAALRDRDEQLKMLQGYLQQERQSKLKAINSTAITVDSTSYQNIAQTNVFKQRLQLQIDQIVNQKNRKIRLLTQDMNDIRQQLETIQKDKLKQIKQIKNYFAQEQDKYIKKIQQKQANIKLLQERAKSFQSQLSNRNLEISRFRHQSPIHSFSSGHDQSKKLNQGLQKKNHEIQQLKRTIEQRNVAIKQLQQKISYLEQQVQSRMFEINSLKRQANQLHTNRAQMDSLNNTIKKKNQQINQLRLTTVQIQQLQINIDSLERQKIRLNEYLKQKTRECEAKDNTLQSLEKKISSLTIQSSGSVSKKVSFDGGNPVINNYQTLLRQRQTEIKNLKYELEMLEAKIQINEKTIRDLNSKVVNYQKSASVIKAQMQNKANRYETDIKALNKQLKTLRDKKQEISNQAESLQSKNISLQRALDERNSLFDRQLGKNKQKASSIQQFNTLLLVDQQLLKSQVERLTKQNMDLNQKIRVFQNKMEQKNKVINDIKGNFNKKQSQNAKFYEQRNKKLDHQLKSSSLKLKKMEEQIANLNKKIQIAESQKKSYRDRLLKDQSTPKQQYIDFKSQYEPSSQDYLEMQKFRLKDPQANDIFERKVIYDLKRQNDFLKKELSGLGPSYSAVTNRFETQTQHLSYQRDFFTERQHQQSKQDEYNNQIINFYKSKTKELENRVDDLLRVNTDLKAKIVSLSANSSNQMSIQFYKDQVAKLESQNSEIQAKIKKMLSDHQSTRDQALGHQHEVQSLKDKLNEQVSKINELKLIIQKHETTITQIQNSKEILLAEIQRLKQTIQKMKSDREEISKKDKLLNQSSRKQRILQQQIAKLNNKISIQAAEIQRLNQGIRNKNTTLDSKLSENNEQSKKLKKRILQLEKQLEIIRLQHHSDNEHSFENSYKVQKLRSFLVQIQSLLCEMPLKDRRAQQIAQHIRHEIHQGLTTISLIQI